MSAITIPIRDHYAAECSRLREENLRLRMALSLSLEVHRDCRPTFDRIARDADASEFHRDFGKLRLWGIDRAIAAAEAAGGSNE